MLPEIGTKEFEEYLKEIGKPQNAKRHKFYTEAVTHMKEMGVHLTGDSPKKLLDIKRPNEAKEAKDYRLKMYKPKTKASANKVTSVINRIYNERLFSVEFNPSPVTTVPDDESLKEYLSGNMPYYVSLMNYIKSVFTKMHLKDPNGIVGILPATFDLVDTDYFEPVPIFYTSEQLVDFDDGVYYVILKNYSKDELTRSQEVIIFDKEYIRVFNRARSGDDFALKFEYNHGFGIVPAFRTGGVVIDTDDPQLFESFIAGVLPHWDEAVCMNSDLQAVIVNHIYPEKWEFTVDCDSPGCNGGTVNRELADGKMGTVNCTSCQGTGKITTKSPFSIYQVNRDAINPDAPLPTPPFGYGEKELGSTELLERLAEKEIEKGYSAVNMDILNKVGENQSGVAKVIDRQDLDTFLDVYSSHVFNYVLPQMIELIILWRYNVVFNGNEKSLKEYFPLIKGPTTFDVYSISLLTEEFSNLKQAGVNGAFMTGIQKDIIEKRFADENTTAFYSTIIDIDPLAHLSSEDMMTNARAIGDTELYIHTYAKDLVEEAISIDESFLSQPLMDQKATIRKLAESKKPDVVEVEPIEENGAS